MGKIARMGRIKKIDKIWNLDFVSLNHPDTCQKFNTNCSLKTTSKKKEDFVNLPLSMVNASFSYAVLCNTEKFLSQ